MWKHFDRPVIKYLFKSAARHLQATPPPTLCSFLHVCEWDGQNLGPSLHLTNFTGFKTEAWGRPPPALSMASRSWLGRICHPCRLWTQGHTAKEKGRPQSADSLANHIQAPSSGLEDCRYFYSYSKQKNFNSIYGNEIIRKFSRHISFFLRQYNDNKLHLVELNILIKTKIVQWIKWKSGKQEVKLAFLLRWNVT